MLRWLLNNSDILSTLHSILLKDYRRTLSFFLQRLTFMLMLVLGFKGPAVSVFLIASLIRAHPIKSQFVKSKETFAIDLTEH